MFAKKVWIKGAGDLASGIALRMHRCGYSVVMSDIAAPTTVRRTVAFSPAVYLGESQVEEVRGILCRGMEEVQHCFTEAAVAVMVDEDARLCRAYQPDILIDAIIAKRNIHTSIKDAPGPIAVGPAFMAGRDCHAVVETKRGHNLGRVIWQGSAAENTGIPGNIGGYDKERIIRASGDGIFRAKVQIGDFVRRGDLLGYAGAAPIYALIDGIVRGILQDDIYVREGMKAGDIDPRCEKENCYTVSDKAYSVGGGVLEAVLCLTEGRRA